MKTNPKLVWKYVKRRIKVCGGIPDINDGMKYLSGSTSKAECFYQYFQSVFLVSSVVETTMCNTVALLEMADIEISEQGAASLLKDLIANSASGPDRFRISFLKTVPFPLAHFLQLCSGNLYRRVHYLMIANEPMSFPFTRVVTSRVLVTIGPFL